MTIKMDFDHFGDLKWPQMTLNDLTNKKSKYDHVAYQMKALWKCNKNITVKMDFDPFSHLKWPQRT